MRIRFFSTTVILAVMACSCGQQSKKQQQTATATASTEEKQEVLYTLSQPAGEKMYKAGDEITFAFTEATDKSQSVDSCILYINGIEISRFTGKEFKWNASATRYGRSNVSLSLRKDGRELTKLNTQIKIFPGIPTFYDYKVVKSYPHDISAYTQGLFIHNNILYESTGQYGQSSLRKVDLATGKVLQQVNLDAKYFGEGSAILDGKIYLLTWESRKGFIYDSETFELIGEFGYPTQGWGLTTDGKYLIMSDGTSIVRFLDPKTFKEVRNIEVCTNKGNINSINELEYINGEIWANIFEQDSIVSINPQTGAVTRVLDMRKLLPVSQQNANTDVLNGIAYNHSTKQLFVTGKNWPFMYEIQPIARVYDKK